MERIGFICSMGLVLLLGASNRLAAESLPTQKVQIALLNANLKKDEFNQISHVNSNNHALRLLNGFIRRPVFHLDKNWKFACSICSEPPKLKIAESSGNKKTYIVSLVLKESLKWSDGKPVSEKDFRFTWILGKSIYQNTIDQNYFFKSIVNIESNPENQREVSIVFKGNITDPNRLFQFHLLPRHIHQPLWRESEHNPKNYLENIAGKTLQDVHSTAIGLGPFKLPSSFSYKDIEVSKSNFDFCLEKNIYFEPEPKSQEICLTFFPAIDNVGLSTKAKPDFDIIIDLKNGLTPVSPKSFSELNEFKNTLGINYNDMQLSWYQRPKVEVLAFNLRNPTLNQAALREIIQYAVYSSLYKNISKQSFNKSSGNLSDFLNLNPSDHPFYSPIKPILSPLKQAELKLEKSGYHLDKSGFRLKQDKQLNLSVSFARSYSKRFYTAALIVRSLERLGIKVKSNAVASGQFYKSILPEIRYPSLAIFGINLTFPHSWSDMLHSSKVPKKNNKFAGKNVFSWIHSNADKVLEDVEKLKKKLIIIPKTKKQILKIGFSKLRSTVKK